MSGIESAQAHCKPGRIESADAAIIFVASECSASIICRMRPIPFALAALLLSSCTGTPYQPIGTDMTGGHSFTRMSEDTFRVAFHGNGFTQPKQAADFAMLRAADVCSEHGFRYFTLLSEDDRSSATTIATGSTSHTTGYVTPYGGYSGTTYSTPTTMTAFKPGKGLTIRCFTQPPGGHAGKVYTASSVAAELRTKYKMQG